MNGYWDDEQWCIFRTGPCAQSPIGDIGNLPLPLTDVTDSFRVFDESNKTN